MIFSLLPNNTYQRKFRVQQRTIKVATNNSSHCTLAACPLPSQQRQAPERACITFPQDSNHIYDQLIKMLYFFFSHFTHYHLDMRLLQGNQNMFCDIHIFSATTAEALHFSIHKLIIVECSAHVQVKFWVVFLCKEIFVLLFHAKKKLRVFSLCNVCNNFVRSSVSATKTSMKVLSIETKVLYVSVKSKPNWVIYRLAKTAERMCVFGRSRKAEMLSRTRWYKNCHNFSSLKLFNSKLGRMLSNSYNNRFCNFYIFPLLE